MLVTQNTANLLRVFIFIFQLIAIGEGLLLTGKESFEWVGSVGFPESDVCVLAARHDIPIIHRIQNRVNLLHSFRVIDFARSTILIWENPNGLIKTRGHEFFARW